MTNDKTLDTITNQMHKECAEDHVGLWEIHKNVKRQFPGSTDGERRDLSLEVVRQILEDTAIKAGEPAKDGRSFNPWDLSVDEILARIDAEWDSLDGGPTIGDIVWFTAME
jgi:hypothetical protein